MNLNISSHISLSCPKRDSRNKLLSPWSSGVEEGPAAEADCPSVVGSTDIHLFYTHTLTYTYTRIRTYHTHTHAGRQKGLRDKKQKRRKCGEGGQIEGFSRTLLPQYAVGIFHHNPKFLSSLSPIGEPTPESIQKTPRFFSSFPRERDSLGAIFQAQSRQKWDMTMQSHCTRTNVIHHTKLPIHKFVIE